MAADQTSGKEITPYSTPKEILTAVTTATVRQLSEYSALLPVSFFTRDQLEEFHRAELLGLHPDIQFGLAKLLVVHFHSQAAWTELVEPLIEGMQAMSFHDVVEMMRSVSKDRYTEATLMEMATGLMKPDVREGAVQMLEGPE